MHAAGLALQPGFAAGANIAREKIAADKPVLVVGCRNRRHRPARSRLRVLPRHARVLATPAEDLGCGRARDGEVRVVQTAPTRLRRRYRPRHFAWVLVLVFPEQRPELIREAAPAAGPGKHQRGQTGSAAPGPQSRGCRAIMDGLPDRGT